MPETTFKRIAHPTDLAKESEFAFYHALRLAVAARSKLDVLHVDEDTLKAGWSEFPNATATLTQWGLPAEVLRHNDGGDTVTEISAYGTEPVHPILGYIDESLPDLMVLATHRRQGLDRWLHKEIAQKLARSRAVATLFVPFGDEGFVSPSAGTVLLRKVLLPLDWIPAPQAAIDAVADLATILDCGEIDITMLHISDKVEDFPAADLPQREGWHWSRQTRSGDVVDEVVAMADDMAADLFVMVTPGHDGFLLALRGAPTVRVLRRVSCPVLAVPAPERSV